MKKSFMTLSLVLVMLISVVSHAQDLPRVGNGLSPQGLVQEGIMAAETDPQVDSEGLAAYYVWYGQEQKESVQRAIASLGGKTTFEFDPTLVPALVVLLPATQAVQASTLDGVTFMEPVPEHRPTSWTERDAAAWRAAVGWAPEARKPQVVPWNVDQVQARDVWDIDRDGVVDEGAPDGSGVRFCIIDSGFFRDHDDFQGIVASGYSQITGEAWYEDGCGHGTHVAGTANAMNNSYGVVGVMPGGAELRILKIFANDCSWKTGQSNLGTAAQWCRDQGANAISMSLGGSYSSTEDAIFQGLYDNNGIIVIAAAGNDGNNVKSYPASYDSVISVAALREDKVVASFSQFPATSYDPNNLPANVEWDVVELSAGGQGVLSTVPSPYGDIPQYEIAVDGVTYYGMHIDESAYGSPSAQLVDGDLCGSTNGAWSGQIVLCERGTYSFAEKVNNVRNSGGLGAVIYNNVSGNFSGTCNGACTQPSIPAISLSQENGQYLVANKLGYVGNLVVDNGAATCPECVGGYDIWDGTSMATPGVAAGVAWVWDSCSGPAGITNKELRQLLRDSAQDLSGTRQDELGNPYTYGEGWDQHSGWGLIQLKDALDLGGERFGWQTCPPPGPFVIDSSPREAAVCTLTPTSVVYDLEVGGKDFEGSIDLDAAGYPAGATAVFGEDPIAVAPAGDWEPTTLTIDNLGSATAGAYAIAVSGVDQADSTNVFQVDVALNLYTDAPGSAILIGPADGAADEAALPTFSWQP
ncbi:MAG: S8 family serine peptidase, partial [Anaerolineae bacterium]|nr:S8 family serine peptidase [Anaerolineae bacterium]